jgi:hypothetical protein
MKYRKILKRKTYPTWVSAWKLKGCKIYVLKVIDPGYYHYQIVCEDKTIYCSLDDGIKFDNFKRCCSDAESWIATKYKYNNT